MASLFELLRDTMPIAAAEFAMRNKGAPAIKFDDVDLSVVRSLIGYVKASGPCGPGVVPGSEGPPTAPALDTSKDGAPDRETQRLWAWQHDDADPAVITDVWCRVNHAGFLSHKVFDSVEWGWEDPRSGEFKKIIKVIPTTGDAIELPLTKELMDSRFLVYDGYLPEDATDLWKLEMRLDQGIVVAFVYEIDTQGSIHAWRQQPPANDQDAADRKMFAEALEDIVPGADRTRPECVTTPQFEQSDVRKPDALPQPGPLTSTMNTTCKSAWGPRIRKGELMPASAAAGSVAGTVPSTAPASIGPMRVLVALCFSTCRERSDFEPGGIVGMARVAPHVMVKANVPLKKIEATVRYNRPEKTTVKAPADGIPGAPMTCHGTYDSMHEEINGLLTTDTNNTLQAFGSYLPMPFWSTFFDYYQTDAFQTLGRVYMKVVCSDRKSGREADDAVERDVPLAPPRPEVGGLGPFTKIAKVARQGEFDNLHIAPKMKLLRVTHVRVKDEVVLVDRAAMQLDDITMAPFCAHDCLHTHWRWGAETSKTWTLGWDSTGPYKVAGAPQVPLNQDVYLWLRSPHEVSYHAVIGRDDGSVDPLPAGEWQIAMHHGSAYAVEITGMPETYVAKFAFDAIASPPTFYELDEDYDSRLILVQNKAPVLATESWALFYWYARYTAAFESDDLPPASKFKLIERLRMTSQQRLEARKL